MAATNEPRLAALETEVADQAPRLEEVEEEKSWVAAKVADLRDKLAKAEGKLEAVDVV